MRKSHGLTLLELLIAIVVGAMLLGLGVPQFSNTIRNSKMVASTNQLIAQLHTARSEAIKRSARVTLCRATLGVAPQCNPTGDGLIIFVNIADDNSVGTGDQVLQAGQWLRKDVSVVSDDLPHYISYAANGFSRLIGDVPATGDLTFCDLRGNDHARVLTLTVTGRPELDAWKTGAPSCN